MPGLGLSLPDVAPRIRGDAAPPSAPIVRIVIEGDSITSTIPNQLGNRGDFYSYDWAAANPALTVSVPAQASRTVGGAAMNGDGADGGSPAGNTLLDHRPGDIAFGPQLLTAMVGANDLGTYQVATYIQRLIAWAGPVRAAGIKVAYAPPTPYRQTDPAANYANYTARRTALFTTADVRDPAVWGQWADYYIPLGEHPDFVDPANDAALYGDAVHPSALMLGAGSGQARLQAIYSAAMTTLLDPGRAAATGPYEAVWPVDETNLAAATAIVRRFIVAGIAHAGLAEGIGVAGGDALVRLNGGAYGTGVGRIYNGDVIDLAFTTAAEPSAATAIALRIGGETRTLTYTTVAQVTPATYAHGGVRSVQPAASTHVFADVPFDSTGLGLLACNGQSAPATVMVGGVAATRWRMVSADSVLSVWTVPITAIGARDIVIGYGAFRGQTALSFGVVSNAEVAPAQVDPVADAAATSQSPPFLTGSLTVPGNGVAVAFFAEYGGGSSVGPATASGGTVLIDEGQGSYQSEVLGIAVGRRTTSGAASFDFGFGQRPRIGIVFKAAGT